MTNTGIKRRPDGCASDLELEELLAGDLSGKEEARLRDHVAGCSRCQERRAALAAEPSLKPDPEAWRPILTAGSAPARPSARLGRRLVVGAGAAVVAAALLLTWNLGRPRPTNDDRVKGALALTVHVKRADGTIDRINGQGRIRPGDEMRFELTTSSPGHAVILGLDAAPSVTTYVPAPGSPPTASAVAAGQSVLAGSIVADEARGVERIFAVACGGETPPEPLRQRAIAALAAAGGHPEAVTSLGVAETGCAETFVTLTKQDP
jgi:hypothetical protein